MTYQLTLTIDSDRAAADLAAEVGAALGAWGIQLAAVPVAAVAALPDASEPAPANDRDAAIRTIRAALKRRSGKSWSVTGGRGSAWGWISIDVPPARRTDDGHGTAAERAELAALLGLEAVHFQGASVPASAAHRREYIDRAEGRVPAKIAEAYWD